MSSNGAGAGRSHRRRAAPIWFPAVISGVGSSAAIIRLTTIRAIRTEVTAGQAVTAEAGEMAVVVASAIEGAPELKYQRFDLAQLPLFGFIPV
jgi:hypothetical protein